MVRVAWFRHLRGLEGIVLASVALFLINAAGVRFLAPGLLLSAGVVYAAARGTRVTAIISVIAGAAALAYDLIGSSGNSPNAVIDAVAGFVIVGGVIAALVLGLSARTNRRVADEREHSERVAALESAKSAFLQLASHELRGPLGIINGYLSMLADGSFGPAEATDIRVAAPILRAKVAEMQILIDSLLDHARLEDVGLLLTTERVDLRIIVDEAVSVIRPIASARHELRWDRPARPVFVEADQTRLQLIVTGLVHNAVKFSPDGGVVQIFVAATDGSAVLSVWDHGLGVGAADVPTLFTRFGRVITPSNAHIGGIGLGLYLARELARLHGGDVSVSTAEGRGSTFTVTLPLAVIEGGDGAVPAPRQATDQVVSNGQLSADSTSVAVDTGNP